MLIPGVNITITEPTSSQYLEFDFVAKLEIEKGRTALTNTCKIYMPRKWKLAHTQDINTVLKRGSKVVVKLGYDGDLRTEFTGYIARLGAKTPTEIICEDEMWNLKQNSFTKSWQKVSLKELIDFVYKGETRLADLQLGAFTIKDQSTAQVLEALKKFALQAYFDSNSVLVVDFAGSTLPKPVEVFYDFSKNIIDNDLEYKRKEDIRIKVKGISKQPNGKKLEFIFGDADGDLRTLNYINLAQTELQKIVKKEIDKLKQDGFSNGFTSFGLPYAEPGYYAVLNDDQYPERNGSYLIEAVTISTGTDGFRRKIKLERKIA